MTDFSAELELSGLMVVGTVGVDHRMAAVEEGEAEEVRRLFDTNYFGTVDMSGHNKFDVADTKMGADGRLCCAARRTGRPRWRCMSRSRRHER